MNQLAKIEVARQALSEAKEIRDVKIILDKAEAIKHFVKQQKCTTEIQNYANVFCVEAQIKLGEMLKEMPKNDEDINNTKKQSWFTRARQLFCPSIRKACVVCNKYKSISCAHHIIPLFIQYKRGYQEPNNEHVWLCPTHHVAVHLLINQAVCSRAEAGDSQIALLVDLTENNNLGELRNILDIVSLIGKEME